MKAAASRSNTARGDWFACFAVLALAAWIYAISVVAAQPGLTSSTPNSYYAWQTEAFRLGQLHLPIPVDPKLLELENPYAGPQGANRPHDMCFYDGKFYLYYGVTPVLLIYLPWRLLTGTFLGEMAGMSVLLWLGLAAGSVWLTGLKRRFFSTVSPRWLGAVLLTVALGSPLFLLTQNNTFYAVPIAGAFACLAVALLCLDRALRSPQVGAQTGWLAAASLAWGLAAGSRPIYVFGLVFLGYAALWLWWKTGPWHRRSWSGLRILAGAVLPAAAIGGGLLLYNYLRFDDPFDFGMRYTLQAVDLREMRLMGPEFIRPNLQAYLFKEATWIRYFPFFAPGDGLYGLLRYAPWLWLAALFPIFALARPLRDRRWFWGILVAGGAAAANFAFLTYFVGDAPRYLIDFAPQWFFVASAAALPVLGLVSRPRCPRVVRLVVHAGLAGALAVSLFNGLMLGLSRHGDRERVQRIARVLNQPTAWWESWRADPHGPMHLQVRFPTNRDSGVEPLLATGGIGGNGDIVTVTYLPNHQVKLGYFHLGIGGPQSEPVTYIPGAIHEIEVTAGGLFPPPAHPRFRDWSAAEIGRLRRQLRITFDGETLLGGSAASYPSSPGLVRLGENHTAGNVQVHRGPRGGFHHGGLEPAEIAHAPAAHMRHVRYFTKAHIQDIGSRNIVTFFPALNDRDT